MKPLFFLVQTERRKFRRKNIFRKNGWEPSGSNIYVFHKKPAPESAGNFISFFDTGQARERFRRKG